MTELTAFWDPLGWALLHSLWQGALVIACIAVLRRKSARPATGYALSLGGLIAVFLAFLATFAFGVADVAQSATMNAGAPTGGVLPTRLLPTAGAGPVPSASPSVGLPSSDLVPWLGVIWCIGFAALSLQCLYAWTRTRVLATTGLKAVPGDWESRFADLVVRSGAARRVRLHVSALVEAPMALGVIRPVVLVPVGFLTGLPAAQVEAILLHELAHIRRHDFALGLVQTAIRTTLYFNPAVRILSRWIDEDREQACDDHAVAGGGRAEDLLRGLAKLRLDMDMARGSGLAMSATGTSKGRSRTSQFMARLERLAGRRDIATPKARLSATLVAGALLGTTALIATQMAPQSWAATSGDHPVPPENNELAGGVDKDDDDILALGNTADIPPIPPLPAIPAIPAIPALPAIPSLPAMPEMPAVTFDASEGFEDAMEEWGERMGEWGEAVGENFEGGFDTEMEAWGESFEENFGEEFETRMEAWGEKMEVWGEHVEKMAEHVEELDEMSDAELVELGLTRADVKAAAESFGLDVAEGVVMSMLPRQLRAEAMTDFDLERSRIDQNAAERARKAYEERAERSAERAARNAKRAAERAERNAERARRRAERDAERAHRRHDIQGRMHRTSVNAFDADRVSKELMARLKDDDIISAQASRYDFVSSPERTQVNGKRQPDSLHKAYRSWLESENVGANADLGIEMGRKSMELELRDGGNVTRVTMNN